MPQISPTAERDVSASVSPVSAPLPVPHSAWSERWLAGIRWPRGQSCPRCDGATVSRCLSPSGRRSWHTYICRSCGKPYNLATRTVLANSRVSPARWVGAIHILCAIERPISALDLAAAVGVCRQTAWIMGRQIIEAGAGEMLPLADTARNITAAPIPKRSPGRPPTHFLAPLDADAESIARCLLVPAATRSATSQGPLTRSETLRMLDACSSTETADAAMVSFLRGSGFDDIASAWLSARSASAF